MESIEKKVTDAILQRASDSIEIEGVKYGIAPATPATLILISEMVASFPDFDSDSENMLKEVLKTAKDLSVIGRIAAVLILGAKRLKEHRLVTVERQVVSKRFSLRKFGFVKCNKIVKDEVEEVERLSELILDNCDNSNLRNIIMSRLVDMQVLDFFAITTSLSVANHLKPTREVEATATAFGG
ncbi:MAG: hypothetical protein IKU25_00510 [Clostridia bacterium]|nr:hypothetical protein [Clostridia bacterium]MBR5271867.1 hypothetical protein [Clostridia bacterium]